MTELRFKPIAIEDKKWIDPILINEDSQSAAYNFGNMFIWDELYKRKLCHFQDRLLTDFDYQGRKTFAFPIGTGDLKSAIEAMREYSLGEGFPFVIMGVTENHKAQLEALYGDKFSFEKDSQDGLDYIYSAEKLSTYSGKALHGKKNHCNRFEAQYQWKFEPITPDNTYICLKMLAKWGKENAQRLDESIKFERSAIVRAFDHYRELQLEGGILSVLTEGEYEVFGFSFGELTSEDTFDVHVEKARSDINGAYPMVCRELTRMVMSRHPLLKYINREEDMGLDALRKSKQSYKPEYQLQTYTARWIDE